MEMVNNSNIIKHITEEDVKSVLNSSARLNDNEVIEHYVAQSASNNMMGFLCDYWKLKVAVSKENERELLSFFIKAVSRTNEAKANMVKELKLYEKELIFYTVIKRCIAIPGLKPWSAKLITTLDNAMVFQDLNALQYKMRDKFQRFDTAHTKLALCTLARFHASSLIHEERKSKELSHSYRLNDEYEQYLNEGGYKITDPWFIQCMKGALEAVKSFSKYNNNKEIIQIVEGNWSGIWESALKLSDYSTKYRNVICHRDLWNNNLLFHYRKISEDIYEADDCLMVDFQAVRCQPPTGDVMLLLYCNLEREHRESNINEFLNIYYQELTEICGNHGVSLENIIAQNDFLASAEEQRLWALIVSACLMPQMWIDDELTTKIFSDPAQFEEILTKDKASFIKRMMNANPNYKHTVLDVFEEIIDRYCL